MRININIDCVFVDGTLPENESLGGIQRQLVNELRNRFGNGPEYQASPSPSDGNDSALAGNDQPIGLQIAAAIGKELHR